MDGLSPTEPQPGVTRARRVYSALAWLFAACVVVQVFLLGLELFEAGVDSSLHRDFSYVYGWLLPAMLLLARVGRLGARVLGLSGLLLVLYALQTLMPAFAEALPLLGPLHAVNALLLFGLGVFLARRAASQLGRPGVAG